MSGPFTYFNNIPQATDQIANSQPQILNNFASIKSIIDVNHGDFATSVAGQHTYVQMTQQASAPAVNAGDVGLYNLPDASSINQMWVRKSDGTSVPMTKSNQATTGYTYLPSGFLVQWAYSTVTSNGATITFAIPYTTALYNVQLTMYSPTGSDANVVCYPIATSFTTTSFKVTWYKRDSGGSTPPSVPGNFFYTAWGV